MWNRFNPPAKRAERRRRVPRSLRRGADDGAVNVGSEVTEKDALGKKFGLEAFLAVRSSLLVRKEKDRK